MKPTITLSALALCSGLVFSAQAEIVTHPIPNSDFPIAQAVEVTGDVTTLYVSGQVPPVIDADADGNSKAAFGDTRQQTIGVIERIKTILEAQGMALNNVVKMQVFLVGDPELDGKMDFSGFMEGYKEYFGQDKAGLPARSAMQVAGLVNPGWLVEIEVTAVKDR
ncbi:RidA family protein [Zobellella sp. DQSA1]|uniref:RidA family protein n=1 Tax=Zobellella sp. DQSA1 TaxID=3342386 RepID=UPI0035C0EEA7